jgi:hypothetical protein
MKYTKELLKNTVIDCISIAGVLRALKIKESGGSHSHISNLIQKFNIDISHFLGQGYGRGKISNNRSHWKKILIIRKSGSRYKAYLLRRSLIESGRKYICAVCGMEPVWNGKEIRLHIDHKNGNWLDNRKKNLRFCCPNCHSQTEGYNGSKGLSSVDNVLKQTRLYRKKNAKKINLRRKQKRHQKRVLIWKKTSKLN